jgi:hypothetical protein
MVKQRTDDSLTRIQAQGLWFIGKDLSHMSWEQNGHNVLSKRKDGVCVVQSDVIPSGRPLGADLLFGYNEENDFDGKNKYDDGWLDVSTAHAMHRPVSMDKPRLETAFCQTFCAEGQAQVIRMAHESMAVFGIPSIFWGENDFDLTRHYWLELVSDGRS